MIYRDLAEATPGKVHDRRELNFVPAIFNWVVRTKQQRRQPTPALLLVFIENFVCQIFFIVVAAVSIMIINNNLFFFFVVVGIVVLFFYFFRPFLLPSLHATSITPRLSAHSHVDKTDGLRSPVLCHCPLKYRRGKHSLFAEIPVYKLFFTKETECLIVYSVFIITIVLFTNNKERIFMNYFLKATFCLILVVSLQWFFFCLSFSFLLLFLWGESAAIHCLAPISFVLCCSCRRWYKIPLWKARSMSHSTTQSLLTSPRLTAWAPPTMHSSWGSEVPVFSQTFFVCDTWLHKPCLPHAEPLANGRPVVVVCVVSQRKREYLARDLCCGWEASSRGWDVCNRRHGHGGQQFAKIRHEERFLFDRKVTRLHLYCT